MHVRKVAVSAAALAVGVGGIALASAPQASATCETLYWNINLSGPSWNVCQDSNFTDNGWNDQASSINTNGSDTRLYWDANYSGSHLDLSGQYWYNLTDFGWNDAASSIQNSYSS